MSNAEPTIKAFFQKELSALRSEAVDFGAQYPNLAMALGLNARESTDPQVELLLQSFAFLSGRLRYQIEQDKAAFPNALMAFLYPHLEAPIPSMFIAEIKPKPEGTNFAQEKLLERGKYVLASAQNNLGRKIECRFKTAYETPLLSVLVDSIDHEPITDYESLINVEQIKSARSVLRVRLVADGVGQLQSKGQGPKRLRFYINDVEENAYVLYELLALNVLAVTVKPANLGQKARLLPPECLRWLGMEDDEAMLQINPHTHSAYRLLQEYFAFPEKFMFFDVEQLSELDFSGVDNQFDLLFFLDSPVETAKPFSRECLRLNCVPLINLFSQRIDPLELNHTEYEYHLMGDLKNHRYCEVISVEKLESLSSQGGAREIAPYFAMDDFQKLDNQDYFYITRRQAAVNKDLSGSELFISFLDKKFNLSNMVDEIVVGKVLCTNRRLPEQLMSGSPLQLEGGGPVLSMKVLTKPTPHFSPVSIGHRPWALVSQLSLNHLSLCNGAAALRAFKDILRLHLSANTLMGHAQIDAIKSMKSRHIVRHMGKDAWRGFVQGNEITIEMDRSVITGGSPVLFCSVLRHFLRLYASVNHLVELRLETHDLKGIKKQWQSLTGTTIAL